MENLTPLKKRGFGSDRYSKERQKEIAHLGGVSAHMQKKAHEWTREEAREAGKKGGKITGKQRKEEAQRGIEL